LNESTDPTRAPAPSPAPTAVVVHLSGDLRGRTQRLTGDRLTIGTAPGADVRLLAHEATVAAEHAELVRSGTTWELHALPGRAVWVDGGRVETRRLANGDVLEIGPEGPVLRFRLYPPGDDAWKSPGEAFEDGLDRARYAGGGRLARAGRLFAGVARELATQTSHRFRALAALALILLLASLAWLGLSERRTASRLSAADQRLRAVTDLVERDRLAALDADDLLALQAEIEKRLSETSERLKSLEARSEAPTRVVSEASASVVFLQGAFGFVDPETGLPYRFAEPGPDGRPPTGPGGTTVVTTEGNGPPLESRYTGTAFVASAEGWLVTNRHIAYPWEGDEAVAAAARRGIQPVPRRLVGYLPGSAEPFEVSVARASESADVALLRCASLAGEAAPLALRAEPPLPGEEVLVLGYPAGIPALLVRSDESFVRELEAERDQLDFWSLARRLAAAGQIRPLATRGIVGQITRSAVVYDAQTTFGGSGGPVLDLDGRVVAVSSAILEGFGGSNLGVPAAEVRRLLDAEATAASPAATAEPPTD